MITNFVYTPEKWNRICDLVHSYPPLAGEGFAHSNPELAEIILEKVFNEIHGLKVVFDD